MLNYFSRFTQPLEELDQIKIIRKNLLREIQMPLSLYEFTTISDLRIKCKLLDHTCDRTTNISESPKVTSQCVAPDLSYKGTTNKSNQRILYRMLENTSLRNLL